MFITTANSLHNIPRPLLDRMEVIEIPGYTEMEKIRIAKGFIIPKQLKENGMESSRLNITDEAIQTLIRNYTMESGVPEPGAGNRPGHTEDHQRGHRYLPETLGGEQCSHRPYP